MHLLSSDTTIQVEAIFTEALLPGLDTRLLHTQQLTGTRDPSKDLTTTRETLVVDCVIVALNAEIKFSTPKGFEPRSRQCRRKVYTTMPQLLCACERSCACVCGKFKEHLANGINLAPALPRQRSDSSLGREINNRVKNLLATVYHKCFPCGC